MLEVSPAETVAWFDAITVKDVTLVAACGASALIAVQLLSWTKKIKPWWEARHMRAEQEKKENLAAGNHLLYAMTIAVQQGDISAGHAETLIKRISNILPDILPHRNHPVYGTKTLKEILQDKHLEDNKGEAINTEVVNDPPKPPSFLMSRILRNRKPLAA